MSSELCYPVEKFQSLLQAAELSTLADADFLSQLNTALAMSDFVVEVLHKQPPLLAQWAQQPPSLQTCADYPARLQAELANITTEEQLYTLLRQFRNREMAALSFCQSLNLMSVEQTFTALSQLAESLIVATRDWLYPKICQELGTPVNKCGQPQPLLILGMGKLGGFELNFSSDIDLIFTYPEKGETVGARRSVDNSQFFIRLAQRIIKALDLHTIDGFVYRTDMRLRPFGDAGALALSFAAMEDYYQEQGRDWERYAMIKARLMGEDDSNPYHQQLKKMLKPFVYRRYIDFSVIQSLRDMKAMIEREIRRRGLVDNIKLGAGGIREVEFIVQVFQLIRGGREPALQHRSLLTVLPHLVQLNLIPAEEAQALQAAYLFLRRVENVLQAIDDKQTQLLPQNEGDQVRLVHACRRFRCLSQNGQWIEVENPIGDWQTFYAYLQQQQQNVRNVFQHLIGDDNENQSNQEHDSIWRDFLNSYQDDELSSLLQQYSFAETTHNELLAVLSRFRSEIQRRQIGQRGREVLNKLMPCVLDKLFVRPDISNVLPKILNIISNVVTRTTYLELLQEHPAALDMLIRLSAASPMIAEQIANFPILLDELLDHKTLFNPPPFTEYHNTLKEYLMRIPQDDEEQQIDALRQFKQATLLRTAAADILEVLPVMKVSDHLTYLAEAMISAVVNLAWRQTSERFGTPDHLQPEQKNFLVIAYGKLGGIELGYNSDLDLVFLYDAPPNSQTIGGKRSIDSSQFYLRLAQKIISIFSMNTRAGILYDVDMRLRPSGAAGLLVSSLTAFETYQQQDAWTWEKQALVRTRAIYGETALRQRFEQIRATILATPRDVAQLRQEVSQMRLKMYEHLAGTEVDCFNIKTDPGGITDIEFIAQYLVLANTPNHPELSHWSDNVRIFDSMAQVGVLSAQQTKQLKRCYVDLRNEIHHLNLIGKKSIVNAEQFSVERAFVREMWQSLLGD
ncbi:bifunctional [glutamate--ammonia ligase]-adenylyl-L-tyrosine phosphorylase/[glutamate--ammonia-ligase] adenylyltransferase [Testudinibacter sp. TR-2022]|uniref:bifunctional [glutamate--ammonia ligase]-adenylyl-L-tyrosine phosphorylase/[glutamate--ammonia-ligase] adenylyltransferase n=1 Tax=Testudinibacter sp. TR-2022 TaxID=2585029 RepID=UPI00111AB735|nr:bifunctional [glutamate--ammonia ligase]-adenylyl-L-tyrosine phosphorylase/[glutamate--ammonia-ligase] adenylyltransferase [Testudinibacter sp. TR-2022]TNH05452.1 bifunctional [glutamate--ammonia ligase]-adenylyl-L-tyrosine phosphorylase/[glutamate--ammonia-ligase] adenylyltransferase [Pasteurellaceae bacterium Phil31]TNH09487.1 bifunctional [glutamate--ammonia ligase]-adenylyl-L-tyrosine phosphorylase/[glutamate--ammonia-ligase] adenylyltransferase [Testudinibacter sp. TR-2022]TNH12316.1 bif